MRKQTLAGVCSLLSLGIVFGLHAIANALHIRTPLYGFASHLVVSFILTPFVMIPMTKLNARLLAWRKARGRDIEEEEKYENTTAGIISLHPVDHDSELNSNRRF
jgi:hypothetical protein